MILKGRRHPNRSVWKFRLTVRARSYKILTKRLGDPLALPTISLFTIRVLLLFNTLRTPNQRIAADPSLPPRWITKGLGLPMAPLRVEVQGSNSPSKHWKLDRQHRGVFIPNPGHPRSPQVRRIPPTTGHWADDNTFAQQTRSARRAAICLYKRGGDAGDGSRLAAEQKKLGKRRACGKSTTSAPSA